MALMMSTEKSNDRKRGKQTVFNKHQLAKKVHSSIDRISGCLFRPKSPGQIAAPVYIRYPGIGRQDRVILGNHLL